MVSTPTNHWRCLTHSELVFREHRRNKSICLRRFFRSNFSGSFSTFPPNLFLNPAVFVFENCLWRSVKLKTKSLCMFFLLETRRRHSAVDMTKRSLSCFQHAQNFRLRALVSNSLGICFKRGAMFHIVESMDPGSIFSLYGNPSRKSRSLGFP